MREGFIKNPLRGKFGKDKGEKFVEENTYRRRFYLFQYLNFPRYHEYSEYDNLYNKVFNEDFKEADDLKTQHLMKGIKLINQIKGTDADLRNTDSLSNETLDAIAKIAANNLFALTKAKNAPEGKKVRVVVDTLNKAQNEHNTGLAFNNDWLPNIVIEYY